MIVLDASAAVEWLVGAGPRADAVQRRLRAVDLVHVPELFDLEILNALRGLVRGRVLSAERAAGAIADLSALRATRWRHAALLGLVWERRDRLSAYDAAYVAVAQLLELPLLTTDAALARAAAGIDVELAK